ncbi:hypothetical protein [Oligosphaera ethanolica]|uniref:Uncharacterized protein n=1 Tax=Oligosphaera ethanolica TaxID=760260 RepID=A0AAE4AQK7_9BACT|nr:hypothetical protein [Oligosphaera ethanolica]MDQ0290517.1 hypothetical protein [Oligosphaera ethanolica]
MKGCILALLAGLLIATGCTHIGTKSIERDLPGFNEAVAQATDQQLLNNIVRLRFRASPAFMSVVNIAASENLSSGASASFNFTRATPTDVRNRQGSTGAQLGYSQQPTISYRPLQGIEFSQHLTRPIPLETMMTLGISGFDFFDIWELFTERLPVGTPSPSRPLAAAPFPDEMDCKRFAALMMQIGDISDFDYRDPFKARRAPTIIGLDSEEKRSQNALVMAGIVLTRFATQHDAAVIQRFRDHYLADDHTVLIYRSLLGTLYDLSTAVPAHDNNAMQGDAPNPKSCRFLKIHCGTQTNDAYCATRYRGQWYWIDNDDMRSKTTLSLLTILYNAISDTGDGGKPQYTIPLR